MSIISPEEFESLLKRFFGFLVGQYQFVSKKQGDFSYVFETSVTKISIYVEYSLIVVEIEPIGEESRKLLRNNILPEPLDINVVAKHLNPNLDFKVAWDESIPLRIERQSQVLKNYCQDFLAGDFTKWIDVLAAI